MDEIDKILDILDSICENQDKYFRLMQEAEATKHFTIQKSKELKDCDANVDESCLDEKNHFHKEKLKKLKFAKSFILELNKQEVIE